MNSKIWCEIFGMMFAEERASMMPSVIALILETADIFCRWIGVGGIVKYTEPVKAIQTIAEGIACAASEDTGASTCLELVTKGDCTETGLGDASFATGDGGLAALCASALRVLRGGIL